MNLIRADENENVNLQHPILNGSLYLEGFVFRGFIVAYSPIATCRFVSIDEHATDARKPIKECVT